VSTTLRPATEAAPAPPEPSAAPHHDRWSALVVWATTAALAVVGVVHITLYGRNIPMSEDWHLVRPLTGAEPSFWGWVWAQNNEHRLPVARLIHLGLLEVFHDFRAGAVFDTLLMAAVAALLVLAARRLRGHTALVDATFPLLLLHPGGWENLFWSWQMQFVVVAAMTLVLLAALATSDEPPTPRTTWVAAVALVLLPLGGGTALPLVPFAIAAVVALAWWPGTRPVVRRVAGGASALAVVLTGLYFVGWKAATWYPDNPGPPETVKTAGKLLALGWGPAARGHYAVLLLLTAAVLVPAGLLVLRGLRRPGAARRPALALGLFLAGVVATAGAVAYGRAALVPTEGLADRYVIVTVPALIGAWFVAQRLGGNGVRRLVQGLVLAGAVLLLPVNWQRGYEWRDWYVGEMRSVERDLDAGVTAEELADRHGDFLMHWDHDELVRRIELLRDAGIGPVARVRPAD
jgi:hypothetical protein